MPNYVHELDFYVDLTIDPIGDGPFGQRIIANGVRGRFVGDRLTGTINGAGGDWLIVDDDGFGRVDVRSTFRTHDGALIYVQYLGLIEMTAGLQAVLAGTGAATDFGDQYFFVAPRMETGDSRYSWVNRTLFIGQGRLALGPRVEFRVDRIEN